MSDILKNAYPELPLSNDLDNRVARLAREAEARRTERQRYTVGFRIAAVAMLALFCIIVGPLLVPRVAVARTLERAAKALRQVQSIHISSWLKSTNGRLQQWEIWQRGSLRRIEADGGAQITVFNNGKLYCYDANSHQTTVRATERFAALVSSGPTIADLQADLKRWGWKDKLEFLPDQVEQGKAWQRVRISREEPAGPVRIEVWIDPTTDLPMRADILLYQNGSWQQFGSNRMTYNGPPQADQFAPPFPKGSTIIDLDHEDHVWEQKLTKTIASASVGGRTVAVRSVEVDATGNVFVLYTAGKSAEDAFYTDEKGTRWHSDESDHARDWEWDITDAKGVRYARQTQSFETDIDKKTGQMTVGARSIIGGEKLEMDWFVPLTAEEPRVDPGQLKMTIRTATRNLHGADLHKFATSIPHALPETKSMVAKAVRLHEAVPTWWQRFLGDGSRNAVPITPKDLIRSRAAEARADHFVWGKNARNLPLALSWLDVEGQIMDAKDPNRSGFHLRRAECLGMMGRKQEARAEVDRGVATWPADWKERTTLYTQVAGIYRSLGDDVKADATIQKAIEESPSDRDWLEKNKKGFRRW